MVLLSGGAGYIGSHMAVELIESGFGVVIADNFSNSVPEVLNRIKKITGHSPVFYEMDVRDMLRLEKVFTENEISHVVHFAGLKAAGESAMNPLSYYNSNLVATISLCDVMQKYGTNKFIFSSSACVYNEDNEMPLTEESKAGLCPNPYGYTKFMSEQILRDVSFANKSWSVINLRYFNLVGAHESGEIGDDPTGVPQNLPPFVSQTAVGKHDCLQVFGNDYPTPDGSCIRDYIHVVDLVKGHVAAMRYADKNTGAETINLGTGRGTSVFEFAKIFEETTGIKIPMKIAERRPGDAPLSYCSPEKAKKLLNWRAVKTMEDGCRDMWKWQLKNPQGLK